MNSYPKKYRLLTASDFHNMRSGSKKLSSKHFLFYYKNNDLNYSRLGLAISKKIGNAVVRNKVKRYAREFFRNLTQLHNNSIDILIVTKPTKFLKTNVNQVEIFDCFERLASPCV